jgi:hypothetical protein
MACAVRLGQLFSTGCPERAGQTPKAEGLVCRPGSVPGRLAAYRSATIHLGPPLPAASCGPPAHSGGQPSDVRCSTLLRAGFAEPARSPGSLVVSCTTVSPLPARGLDGLDKLDRRGRTSRRFVFCGTVPRITPGGCCPPPCPGEPGPSSAPLIPAHTCQVPRPPDQPLRVGDCRGNGSPARDGRTPGRPGEVGRPGVLREGRPEGAGSAGDQPWGSSIS